MQETPKPHPIQEHEKPVPRIQITYRRVNSLHPDPKNPRIHTPKQIRQIKRSIENFGFNVPILVDGQDRVIAGHGRLFACRELGWEEVPTISLEHLSEAQAKAFMVADNRLTEIADWDNRLLAEQLRDLSVQDLNFSLEVTGFDFGEIDLRIEGLGEGAVAADAADTIPEPPSLIPVTQLGYLWQLGKHRVLCGNALESYCYRELMAGRKADVVFTDPPYNVPIDGHVGGLGQVHHRDFPMACGEMSVSEFTEFLHMALSLAATSSKDGSLHYVFTDWRHVGELLVAGKSVFTECKNLCAWVKHNAGMGSFYRSQHELVLVFKHGTAPHQNNIQLGKYGRSRSNVWHYPGVNAFGRSGEEGNLLALHPTVKPVALIADALMDSSARGDLVLDPFLGSGSTLIAAERVGRVCYGLELDPLYVDTIIRRWQAWTGLDAVHGPSKTSFKAREKELLPPSTQTGDLS